MRFLMKEADFKTDLRGKKGCWRPQTTTSCHLLSSHWALLISVHSQLTSTNQSAPKKLTAADGMFYIRAIKTSSFSTSSFFFFFFLTMLCFTPVVIWEKHYRCEHVSLLSRLSLTDWYTLKNKSRCWFYSLIAIKNWNSWTCVLSSPVCADVKMLRTISSLQMILPTFFTFLHCLCSGLSTELHRSPMCWQWWRQQAYNRRWLPLSR